MWHDTMRTAQCEAGHAALCGWPPRRGQRGQGGGRYQQNCEGSGKNVVEGKESDKMCLSNIHRTAATSRGAPGVAQPPLQPTSEAPEARACRSCCPAGNAWHAGCKAVLRGDLAGLTPGWPPALAGTRTSSGGSGSGSPAGGGWHMAREGRRGRGRWVGGVVWGVGEGGAVR